MRLTHEIIMKKVIIINGIIRAAFLWVSVYQKPSGIKNENDSKLEIDRSFFQYDCKQYRNSVKKYSYNAIYFLFLFSSYTKHMQ